MSKHIKIDFVSDVSCPWCVIGLKSLEQALSRLGDDISVDMHFQPFELNPQLGAAGEDSAEHLKKKYGATPEQSARSREAIRARGEELGFRFEMGKRARIYNTFDAHRLLHWAELEVDNWLSSTRSSPHTSPRAKIPAITMCSSLSQPKLV